MNRETHPRLPDYIPVTTSLESSPSTQKSSLTRVEGVPYAIPPKEAGAYWDKVWNRYRHRAKEKHLDDPKRQPSYEFLHTPIGK